MAGYDGYSMSNNARAAYTNEEKPLSKWTKSELLDGIEGVRKDIELFKKLTVKELKNCFLHYSSWHHTSKHYNETNFYSLDEDQVLEFTKEKADEIINQRPIKRTKADKEKHNQLVEKFVETSKKAGKYNGYTYNGKALTKCSTEELEEAIQSLRR